MTRIARDLGVSPAMLRRAFVHGLITAPFVYVGFVLILTIAGKPG